MREVMNFEDIMDGLKIIKKLKEKKFVVNKVILEQN